MLQSQHHNFLAEGQYSPKLWIWSIVTVWLVRRRIPVNADAFLQELDALKAERLAGIVGAGQTSLLGPGSGDAKAMLQVALANEISVCELAAAWTPRPYASTASASSPTSSGTTDSAGSSSRSTRQGRRRKREPGGVVRRVLEIATAARAQAAARLGTACLPGC